MLVDRNKNCPGQHIVDEFWCISVDNSDEISKHRGAVRNTML